MPEVNECEPIVIYPLGVSCQSINPTGPKKSDGSATVIITGGTSPYTIKWENGNTTQTISNLSVGSYTVTVVDYFGDYSATTTCVLSAVGPTPTPPVTPTPTPVVTYDYCMVISYLDGITNVNDNVHMNPNGIVNGKQSWISDDSEYTVTWNNQTNLWSLNNYPKTIINSNPAYPPFNNWQVVGTTGSVNINDGECESTASIGVNISTNPPDCTSCDGTINLVGNGGTPPYQYSNNGGVTWVSSPIFEGLCSGVQFNIKIKDSLDNVYTPTVNNPITFNSVSVTTYAVSIGTTFTSLSSTSSKYVYTINVSPPLPNGVTLTLDLILKGTFVRTPYFNSASSTFTPNVTKNGTPLTPVDTTNETITQNQVLNCTSYINYFTNYIFTYPSITITSSDVYVIESIVDFVKTCQNTPLPGGMVYTPEPTPTPIYEGEIEEYVAPFQPLSFIGGGGNSFEACCDASFLNMYSSTYNKASLSGCQCCNVGGGNTGTFGY